MGAIIAAAMPAQRPPSPTRAAEVALPGPVDLELTLEPLRRVGDDLLDRWDGTVLRRTIPGPKGPVAYAATIVATGRSPRLRVEVARAADLPAAAAAVAELALTVDAAVLADLAARDPIVATVDARHPGVRQLRYPDLFSALVRAVSAQQVNLRWAATTRRRLAELAGTRHAVGGGEVWSLDPARLADHTVADIRELQFTTRKAEFIVGLAEEVASGRLTLDALRELPDEEAIAKLVALRGIGRWTAEWVLARTLGRPVVVAGDLAVRKVVGLAYEGRADVAEQRVRELTAHWGEAGGVATWLLIHAHGAGDDLPSLSRQRAV
jgi:DNA-3-methyladenine glycosylase II